MKIINWLAGGAIAAGGYFGIRYLALKRLNDEIQVVISANINKVSLTSMELKIDILIKNPTSGTIDVKYPFVKVYYSGTLLGSSEVKDKDFPIPKYSQMQVDPIYLTINLMGFLSIVPKLLNDLQKNAPVAIQVVTVTTLNNSIPYTRTNNITIK
jgi:hypothetical protein